MDILKTITSQILAFEEDKTICLSVNDVSRLFSVRALDYIGIEEESIIHDTEHLSRVIINLPQNNNLIIYIELDGREPKDTNKLAQEKQYSYIIFLNRLRTLIALHKVSDIIDLIEKSTLVNFVDTESLELIKEAIKTSAE